MTSRRKSTIGAPAAEAHAHAASAHAVGQRAALTKRLNRIEGQVRGIG